MKLITRFVLSAACFLSIIVALATATVTAWSCGGHTIIAGIAQAWLRQNFPRGEAVSFFDSVVNAALKYNGQPIPKITAGNVPMRSGFSTLGCVADDVRGHEAFADFSDTHYEDAHCFPLNSSTKGCPARFAVPVNERDHKSKSRGDGGRLVKMIHQVTEELIKMAPTTGHIRAGSPQAVLAFVYLLHLVADAAQPLHACSAFGPEFAIFYSPQERARKAAAGAGALLQLDASTPTTTAPTAASDEDDALTIADDDDSDDSAPISQSRRDDDEFHDRGGNFWCLRKPDQKRKNKKARCGKDNLHSFWDKAGGFLKPRRYGGGEHMDILDDIVRGKSPVCEGCTESVEISIEGESVGETGGDPECCIERMATALIDEVMENSTYVFSMQLKLLNTDAGTWLERDRELCNSTRMDKVRRPRQAPHFFSFDGGDFPLNPNLPTDEEEEPWMDGKPLVPGAPLSQNYKDWAQYTAKRRLVLAGYRLGKILKLIYSARNDGGDNNNGDASSSRS